MFTTHDIDVIESGDIEPSFEEYYISLQRAINDGYWGLQGSYGRAMMGAIEDGYCMLGRKGFRDYYGNYIPSRGEVQDGTKGSVGYVFHNNGEHWAAMMAEVE